MAGEYTSSAETRRGYVTYVSEKTGKVKIKEIEYAIVNGRAVFEGDIVIGTVDEIAAAEEEGQRRLRSRRVFDAVPEEPAPGMVVRGCVIVGSQYRWPNRLIPYTIDSGLPNQARVTDAIQHWEDNTPIRFKVRDSETAYVTFISDPEGCWSYVGRQGNQQHIGLAAGCSTGNCIHEIGHAVGLWHEQSREDRDSFVTIHWENIEADKAHNFNQQIADGDDVGPYDYDSLMHYGRTAFSTNGDTITPPAGVTIGQRTGLSTGDIQAVVYMYGTGVWYVGNRRTRELHLGHCPWVRLMSPWNKRYYWTVEDAKHSGYNGCYYCLRFWDTG